VRKISANPEEEEEAERGSSNDVKPTNCSLKKPMKAVSI